MSLDLFGRGALSLDLGPPAALGDGAWSVPPILLFYSRQDEAVACPGQHDQQDPLLFYKGVPVVVPFVRKVSFF